MFVILSQETVDRFTFKSELGILVFVLGITKTTVQATNINTTITMNLLTVLIIVINIAEGNLNLT